jgi:hypothetical protein
VEPANSAASPIAERSFGKRRGVVSKLTQSPQCYNHGRRSRPPSESALFSSSTEVDSLQRMLGLRTHPLYESPTTEVCPLLRIAPAEFKGGIKEKPLEEQVTQP